MRRDRGKFQVAWDKAKVAEATECTRLVHEYAEAVFNAVPGGLGLSLVKSGVLFFEDQIFHPRIREFLTGLTEQHHQDDPLDLLNVDIGSLQGEEAVDQDFTLHRREDADLFEVGNEAATAGIETVELDIIVDTRAVSRLRVVLECVVVVCQAVEPVERPVDLGVSESGAGKFVAQLVLIRLGFLLSVDVRFETGTSTHRVHFLSCLERLPNDIFQKLPPPRVTAASLGVNFPLKLQMQKHGGNPVNRQSTMRGEFVGRRRVIT